MGEKKAGGRGGIIAIVVVVVLLLAGGGTALGVTAYNNAQATRAAEEMVASVVEQRNHAEGAIAEYEQNLSEAERALEQLEPLNEMVQAREEVFEIGSAVVFDESVASLASKLEETAQPKATLGAPFSGSEWAQAFIDEYRAANAEERETLEGQAQQAVNTLHDAQQTAESAGQDFLDSILGARHAAMLLAQQMPEKGEELIESNDEAAAGLQDRLREAANAEAFEGVTDEELQTKIDELQDHLIVYIETADKVKESHDKAVEERKAAEAAAEAAAAEAAAATETAASSGGGGGGGGGLCYRWTWLGTVLEPC